MNFGGGYLGSHRCLQEATDSMWWPQQVPSKWEACQLWPGLCLSCARIISHKPHLENVLNCYIFLWQVLTSHNLCHSDLFRMERSRITQSHAVITWPKHASYSWFHCRCQQASEFLLHNQRANVWRKSWNWSWTSLWILTNLYTHTVRDYTETGTVWLDDILVTVQNGCLWVTTVV